jgi:hypothetical protein
VHFIKLQLFGIMGQLEWRLRKKIPTWISFFLPSRASGSGKHIGFKFSCLREPQTAKNWKTSGNKNSLATNTKTLR